MSKHGANLDRLHLPQAMAYQCDMLVWRSAAGAGAIGHPGHAALVLRRERNIGPWHFVGDAVKFPGATRPPTDLTAHRYLSFWPFGEKKGKSAPLFSKVGAKFREDHLDDMFQELSPHAEEILNGGGVARTGQLVLGYDDEADDIWGQWPQVIVTVPALNGTRADRLGVDLNRMVAWAARFKNSDEFNYTFVSKSQNCAGVAVRALVAGGGEAFGALGGNHSKGTLYMLPNDAQRWAEAVSRGIDLTNNMLADLRNRTAHLPAGPIDLMSVANWKSTSAVSWSIRGRMTAAIDSALRTFHENRWTDGFPAKLAALVVIVRNVHDHLRTESRRNDAYLELAREVMGVVGWLARGGDAAWSPTDYYGSRAYAR